MGNCLGGALENCNMENTENFSLRGKSMKVKVLDVYDGDTITLAFKFERSFYKKRCRVYGVNCPEIKTKNKEEKKKGEEAREYLKKIVLGKILKVDFEGEDKYGRLLGIVYVQNERLDLKLIREGYGVEYFGGKKV